MTCSRFRVGPGRSPTVDLPVFSRSRFRPCVSWVAVGNAGSPRGPLMNQWESWPGASPVGDGLRVWPDGRGARYPILAIPMGDLFVMQRPSVIAMSCTQECACTQPHRRHRWPIAPTTHSNDRSQHQTSPATWMQQPRRSPLALSQFAELLAPGFVAGRAPLPVIRPRWRWRVHRLSRHR